MKPSPNINDVLRDAATRSVRKSFSGGSLIMPAVM